MSSVALFIIQFLERYPQIHHQIGDVLQGGGIGADGSEGVEYRTEDDNGTAASSILVNSQQRREVQEMLSDMEYEEKRALGHQLEDMVLECSFAGNKCNLT